MQLRSLEIRNIGPIKEISIEINKPLIAFYGDLRQGKTKALEGIQLCFGGSFPDDIIRHGEKEAHVIMKFDNMAIKRRFWINKHNAIEAKLTLIKDMDVKKKPIEIIKDFLNPFLLDQNFFIKKTPTERDKYFIELFNIDQAKYQKKLFIIDEEAKELRSEIKGFGEIDITPVELIDIDGLYKEKETLLENFDKELDEIQEKNNKIRNNNKKIEKLVNTKRFHLEEVSRFKSLIRKHEQDIIGINNFLESAVTQTELKIGTPDTTELDKQISEAAAQNERFNQYQKNKKRADEKDAKSAKLQDLTASKKTIEKTRLLDLAEKTKDCSIPDFRFDLNAKAYFEETTLAMLSTSQIMRLSSHLKQLYPQGFGLELIDRAESLGFAYADKAKFFKAVTHYIDEAKKNHAVILAAVVGDKPAECPEDVGVYVIEDGRIKDDEKGSP